MRSLVATAIVLCAGCASYMTPGGPVRLAEISRTDGAETAARQPSPQLPIKLGVIRVQAPAYRSYSSVTLDGGSFSVVTAPDLLSGSQLQALSQWPSVATVASIDAELLPDKFTAVDDLRLAAAKMQVDVLLVYTIDTAFHINGHAYGPLAKIPLKPAPDGDAYVGSTASAVFLDVRTGYRYGSAEAAAKVPELSTAWGSDQTIDAKRLEAEQRAFTALLSEADKTWRGIAVRYQ